MRFVIAGNGPSLNTELTQPLGDFRLIFTNRLLFDSSFSQIGGAIYVCGDVRFLESHLWKSLIKRRLGKTYLSERLARRLIDCELQVSIVPTGFTSEVARKYFSRFAEEEFPAMNVVLDYAIPVALDLGASHISLSGCDFSYGEDPEQPAYWSGYRKEGAAFDHTIESRNSWSRDSRSRYLAAQSWLKDLGITLENSP